MQEEKASMQANGSTPDERGAPPRKLSRGASILGALKLPRSKGFFKKIVRTTMNVFTWKSQPAKESFSSTTWQMAFFRRKSEIYKSQTEPEEAEQEEKGTSTNVQMRNVVESVDLVPAIKYVQSRMNEKEKKHGITRFDLVQLLALRPRAKQSSQGVHELYCAMHSSIHTRCWEFEPKCRMTGKDFENFWDRRSQEEEYHAFMKKYVPGENIMLTEGLIRVIEKCQDWSVMARSLQLLADICIKSRPVIAFSTLITDRGIDRIWRHVRGELQRREGSDPTEHADKLQVWWNFVFTLLKDAHVANVPGGTNDVDNFFFDPMMTNKKAVRIIGPADVVKQVWDTYHPRHILYAIGDTAISNHDLLEIVSIQAWRILDLGAVEFLAQRSVGGTTRLRSIMDAFTTFKWNTALEEADARAQLVKMKTATSKLESMLKSDATFCLTAALYGMPFFLELVEWWIRECPIVLSTADLRTTATTISGDNLKVHFDKMEKFVHLIYRGDEDVDDRDDAPILKAREARHELNKTQPNFRNMVMSSLNVTKRLLFNSPVDVPEPKPSPKAADANEGKTDENERPESPINVEAENAWEALLRVIGK